MKEAAQAEESESFNIGGDGPEEEDGEIKIGDEISGKEEEIVDGSKAAEAPGNWEEKYEQTDEVASSAGGERDDASPPEAETESTSDAVPESQPQAKGEEESDKRELQVGLPEASADSPPNAADPRGLPEGPTRDPAEGHGDGDGAGGEASAPALGETGEFVVHKADEVMEEGKQESGGEERAKKEEEEQSGDRGAQEEEDKVEAMEAKREERGSAPGEAEQGRDGNEAGENDGK